MTRARSVAATREGHAPRGTVVVGLGWGLLLARVVNGYSGTRLLGVVDLDGEKAQRVAGELGTAAFTSVEEALRLPGVEAALIAVPPDGHVEVATRCIDAGLHVYVEKPVGRERSPQDVIEISERARAAGVRFMPGYSQRFKASVRAAVEVVRSGGLGTVLSVDILRQSWFGPAWTVAPGWGIHDYHLCNVLAGAPPRAVTAFSPSAAGYDRGHTTEVIVEHDGGAISRCKTSMFASAHEEVIRVHGERGEIVAYSPEERMQVRTRESEREVRWGRDPGFVENALVHFFEQLDNDGDFHVTPEEALQGRLILNATWQSLESGARVIL